MSDSVDKIFRKALEEVTVEPPARVWEAIDAHFALKQRRQRRLFWYGSVAALPSKKKLLPGGKLLKPCRTVP